MSDQNSSSATQSSQTFQPSFSTTYAPSIQSTSSSKPLLTNTSSSSKSTKAWSKTKKFLSSIGEPPTAEYDRQQEAKNGIKTAGREASGREAFGAVNYGPYRTGSSVLGGDRTLGRI